MDLESHHAKRAYQKSIVDTVVLLAKAQAMYCHLSYTSIVNHKLDLAHLYKVLDQKEFDHLFPSP